MFIPNDLEIHLIVEHEEDAMRLEALRDLHGDRYGDVIDLSHKLLHSLGEGTLTHFHGE